MDPGSGGTSTRNTAIGDAGGDAGDDVVSRVRRALELVHDPAVEVLKRAAPTGAVARSELQRRCAALLRHVWRLVRRAYHLAPDGAVWAVHRPGDRRNCIALAHGHTSASMIAAWWAGPAVTVTRVDPQDPDAEEFIAMAVALHWTRPPWLPFRVGREAGPAGE